MKVLLLTKKGYENIVDFTKKVFPKTDVAYTTWGEKEKIAELGWGKWDYMISYCSRWVLSGWFLDRAQYAINFHPGPPEYPGIGCTNFALYDNAEKFGVTCHYMVPKVDSGPIVDVWYFPIYQADTVESLTHRTHIVLEYLYYDIMDRICNGRLITRSMEWSKEPTTRKNLNELGKIGPWMNKGEINKRIRAMTYKDYPGCFVEIEGHRFEYKGSKKTIWMEKKYK